MQNCTNSPEDQAASVCPPPPQFPGDDTRPTSKKELAGWYSYGWAAEVFTVCAMGSFLPITLEQMARERGVLLSDKKTPCSATWSSLESTSPSGTWNTIFDATAFTKPGSPRTSQCIIYILGVEINTASFAMYTFSLSVFIQAILIISMSGAADHGSYRKMLLVIFALIGSVSTMLFLAVVPRLYLLGGLFAIISNTCFGASFVLLNSFLPLLVRYHPILMGGHGDGDIPTGTSHDSTSTADGPGQTDGTETTSLLRPEQNRNAYSLGDETQVFASKTSQELKLSTKLSSNGIGIGYIGAVILQAICILVVVETHQTTFSLRLVLFLIGLWWFTFTIPAAMWLRARPGPPLPYGKESGTWTSYMAYAWKSLGRTVMRTRHLRDILLFLAAWFLLSDGIATVSGTAVLFAKTQLGMQPAALGLINVIAMIAGVFGAFSWSFVSRTFNLRASQTIVACIILFELVPLYGLLGFIPAIKSLGYLGLQQPWEMYPLGVIYGLVMGGLSSYCRSFFGELIPPGYEAAFYALYAITDKGSSVFGPAIVGIITDRYGEIRPAFVFLAVLILLPLPLMLLVDVERGKRDALSLSKELEGRPRQEVPVYGAVTHCPSHSENLAE
ncbi:autophagy-related protein 22-1 [Aspergillus awamori]|uniref:Autophagy-related protein n=2 Tax=Aspergillus TaxID=5052 RepID=A0A3F3PSX8_9EURO|nr:autophagy-related protein 22-1 [Aspergillus welwitschiae]GCB17882.1 autophagy-related protein 22-1 [Aspergillus awamori]GKZ57196.1 autophagy protein 22 [Aspergillus niger]RDH30014.1 autophagy-related protein 22-1 [Aspergillus welwitschiae]GKZ67272.1 autophagy protein 22 [Aspergillus niger]GKZ77322.1 autophagy protein 22 [Aspergillus niger]